MFENHRSGYKHDINELKTSENPTASLPDLCTKESCILVILEIMYLLDSFDIFDNSMILLLFL